MAHIYCPYCAAPYEIDESLLPEKGALTRCRFCSMVFTINKDGTVKEDEAEKEINETPPPAFKMSGGSETSGKAENEIDDKTSKGKVSFIRIMAFSIFGTVILLGIIYLLNVKKLINLNYISDHILLLKNYLISVF